MYYLMLYNGDLHRPVLSTGDTVVSTNPVGNVFKLLSFAVIMHTLNSGRALKLQAERLVMTKEHTEIMDCQIECCANVILA